MSTGIRLAGRSRAAARRLRRVGGMTLLELLVAHSIMALPIALIYRSAGGSAKAAGDLQQSERAAILARSLLDAYEVVGPQGVSEQGQDGLLQWQIASVPELAGPPALQRLFVTISWGEGPSRRTWALQTLRPVLVPPLGMQR